MRFLHVIHSLDPRGGGPAQFVRQTMELAAGSSDEFEVLSLDAPDTPFIENFPGTVHAIGPAALQYGYSARLVSWLRDAALTYDLVIVNGLWQFSSFGTWLALNNATTPYVVFPHGMLDPWFNEAYPLKHLKKMLYWPWAEYRVLRDASRVLFTADDEMLLAARSFSPYRCNSSVVGFGTIAPPERLADESAAVSGRFPELSDGKYLLFLGRVHEKKGVDLLLEAFRQTHEGNPALRLVIAGPGERSYVQHLRSIADAFPESVKSRIVWTDMVEGDIKWGLLRQAEALVLPSHQENFGLSVSEALSCGTPALVSNRVNIWREIVEARAGFAQDDTLEGTRSLLSTWASLAPADKHACRQSAVACFRERFDLRRNFVDIVSVLRDCAGGRKPEEN